jgi:3-phenylpropionate/cinnamic acid dioxygenase small subunit
MMDAFAEVDDVLLREVTRFIYREARLQDDHEYDAWEALWAEDGIYWVPANGEDGDPEHEMSLIYDNRSRIGLRIKQLRSGKRHTQMPRSRLRRIVSNIEILKCEGVLVRVTTNAAVYESNARGEIVWPSRNEYVLRREGSDLRMALKKVVLVNNEQPLYTLSFLI